jgi:hypothetical protein
MQMVCPGETGFAEGELARFVLAQLLDLQDIQAEFWSALLAGSLFDTPRVRASRCS